MKRMIVICVLIVAVILTIIMSVLARRNSGLIKECRERPPFDIVEDFKIESGLGDPMWVVSVIVPKECYSRENLEEVFHYFTTKHPNRKDRLRVKVYTSRDNRKRDVENSSRGFMQVYPPPAHEPSDRRVFYDSIFNREGDGIGSAGENESYTYCPNLNSPNETKVVLLRGMLRFAPRDVIGEWESGGPNLRVRFTSYTLKDTEPVGPYCTVESMVAGSGEWTSIFSLRQSEINNSSVRNHVRFISDQIAYVFVGSQYAGTTDGGRTWFSWDATEAECCSDPLIRDVHIAPNGTGNMQLVTSDPKRAVLDLQTSDYGRRWFQK